MTRLLPIVLVALLSASCGASALDLHTRAAYVTGELLTAAHNKIDQERTGQTSRAIDMAPDDVAATAARDGIDLRFAPLYDAFEGTRAAHALWVRLILAAAAGESFDVMSAARLASDLLQLWSQLVPIAADLGIDLPADLGGIVNAVLGATQ